MSTITYKNIINYNLINNLIFIDSTVQDYEKFYDNLNENTFGIIYNKNSDKDEILNLLKEKFVSLKRLCLVIDNSNVYNKIFINNQPFFTIEDLTETNNQNYSTNLKFIIEIIKTFGITNFDNLMCYSMLYDNWNQYYDILKNETNTIIGASSNQTGNVSNGGDWLLESINEDIQNIYFTNGISNYNLTLAITISGAQGTTTYMRLNGSTIQYSTDSTFASGVNDVLSWPITLTNSTTTPSSAFTLKLVSNITISSGITGGPTASTGCFVIGSNWITIDGDFYGATIGTSGTGISSYQGLIQNGTGTNAFSNITVTKLGVLSLGGSTLNTPSNASGWLGKTNFGNNGGTTTNSSNISLCWSNGDIAANCGGLLGSNSANTTIINCYSSNTNSLGSKAGGIVGLNGNYLYISQCYSRSWKAGSGNPGGIAGDSLSNSTVNNCYCFTNNIATTINNVTITYCYVTSSTSSTSTQWSDTQATSGGSTGNTLDPSTSPTYETISSVLYLRNQIGSVWTDTSYYDENPSTSNTPWILTAFNRSPYSVNGSNPVITTHDTDTTPLPYTIPHLNTRLLQGAGYTYSLIGNNNQSPVTYSTITMGTQSNVSGTNPSDTTGDLTVNTGTFNGSYSINVLYEDTALSSYTISTVNLTQSTLCFHSETKILCVIEGKEVYIPIKDIKIGTEVKTYLHGNKKVILIGMCKLVNNPIEKVYSLYKLSKEKVPELLEDLYVSGLHSILVDNLTLEQSEKTKKYWKKFLKIDDKYLLMACVCEDFEICENYNTNDMYQIVLENDNEKERYGIWANGILSESMSLNTFKKKNRFTKIESTNENIL